MLTDMNTPDLDVIRVPIIWLDTTSTTNVELLFSAGNPIDHSILN